MDSQTFIERLQRSKHLALKSYLYHRKVIEVQMSKMGLHDLFGYLQHKLWQKRKVRSKTSSLIPDHKKLGLDLTSMRAGGVQYAIGKLSTRATTLL